MGALPDPHLKSVAAHVPSSRPLVVFDAASIQQLRYSLTASTVLIETTNGNGSVHLDVPHRGWIRRPIPANWALGTMLGSKRSAVNSSWHALIVALLQNTSCEWLTTYDTLLAAENKIVQYQTAVRHGINVPPTGVSNMAEVVRDIATRLIAKPLGPEQYWLSPMQGRRVFADTIDLDEPGMDVLIKGAPFIVQARLSAVRHLRIVTVNGHAWSFALPADNLPLDWRENVSAHSAWRPIKLVEIEESAVRLSSLMSVRYSSQDWIETVDGTYFIDLNPGGQWLFLPEPGALEISKAIASWLLALNEVSDFK